MHYASLTQGVDAPGEMGTLSTADDRVKPIMSRIYSWPHRAQMSNVIIYRTG